MLIDLMLLKGINSRRFSLSILGLLTLALWFVGRKVQSWKVQRLAVMPFTGYENISADGRWLVTSHGHDLAVVSLNGDGQVIKGRISGDVNSRLTLSAYSPDQQQIAFAWHQLDNNWMAKEMGVVLWALDGRQRQFEAVRGNNLKSEAESNLSFSADGKTVSLTTTHSLYVWNVQSGRIMRRSEKTRTVSPTISPYAVGAPFVAYSADRRTVYTSTGEWFESWNTRTGRRLGGTKIPGFRPDYAFADAKLGLLFYELDGAQIIADLNSGKELWRTTRVIQYFDDSEALIINDQVTINVVDVRTGQPLRQLVSIPNAMILGVRGDNLYIRTHEGVLYRQRYR